MFRTDQARSTTTPPTPAPPRWHRDHVDPPGVVAPGALAAAASVVAMWPFTAVIEPGPWSLAVVAVIVSAALTGMLLRRMLRRGDAWLREAGAFVAQALVAVAVLTQITAADTAVLGLIPTTDTVPVFAALGAAAWEQVVFGTAPLDSSPGLAAVMGAGFAAVAILLDHLVASRSAVIATLLTGTVGAIPMIVTLGEPHVVWFGMFGAVALLLFRFTARRHPLSPRRSTTSLAVLVGAAALAATIVVAPAVPVTANLAGTGVGVTVDASLRLGDDLRQPNPVEVLTVAAKGEVAPYLRLTTLSQFDGRVWQPDRGDLQSQREGFGEPEWTPDIAIEERTTSIRVLRMSSSWLPVPYPATGVQGLNGSWRVATDNRTLFSRSADAAGNDYTVRSARVIPTLEQIRALEAAEPAVDDATARVELPSVIAATAEDVTARASTDYDRLVALQTWFRSDFVYSLETPVEEGFDGTGAEAVARFLDEKSGYCVHFAGAFALMAESLGMQARIVVGYLPGALTDEKRGDESIFSVSSDQLHSWPEVLFPGVGWIPFEPTASLGTPTAFQAAAVSGGGTGGPAAPAPTSAPTTEESAGPEIDRRDTESGAGATGELRSLDPTPVVLSVAGVLVLLLLPALIRRAAREVRLRRAHGGDPAAAWTELRSTLIDLQLPVSDADTPRMRAAELVRENGVDADAMSALTDAVERASYARSASASIDLAVPLGVVLARLHRSVDGRTRARALLLPRSLFVARSTAAAASA
ncbi:transglutaminaseTgpA domain-containing protein [Microbacterium sp. 179-I 3D2 NHS]|uniref:transglutaminase family protein n=1 Tax=Microbacterium sp. 179-I 3D2 NHS TaxID=3235178 RepID=UPI0039A2DDCC